MVELAILRLFIDDRDIYIYYRDIYKNTNQEKEIKDLFNLIEKYYKRYEEKNLITKDDFLVFYESEFPHHKYKDVYRDLVEQIYNLHTSKDLVEDLIRDLVSRDYASQIAQAMLPAITGERDIDLAGTVQPLLDKFNSYQEAVVPEDPFFKMDLADICEHVESDGLTWRLSCMQRALGSLVGGTLGHVFARPEAGKTSFLHSEVTYLASQLEGEDCILWINNEESPHRIYLRSHASCCGLSEDEVKANPAKASSLYKARGGDRIKLLDAAVVTVSQIDKWCMEYKPRLVVVDQGDKLAVDSGGNMSTPERLKAIYDQLREVVKKYNKEWKIDILTVGQADQHAENKRILTMANLDSGKTGKAGAFDYIIGIGFQHDQSRLRYITFPKNKLKGDHATYTVNFDGDRGRYSD